jgi:adenylylsulfate kinase
VEVLDGDEMRAVLSPELGFSRADRETNVRRIGHVARLLARNDVVVLVPVIAPYADVREQVRKSHEAADVRYVEVHVATPIEICARRDAKGLYARQSAGEISGLTGIDDPYEAPENPDLRIPAHELTVEECVDLVSALLLEDAAGGLYFLLRHVSRSPRQWRRSR